jgi:hypothetical protein
LRGAEQLYVDVLGGWQQQELQSEDAPATAAAAVAAGGAPLTATVSMLAMLRSKEAASTTVTHVSKRASCGREGHGSGRDGQGECPRLRGRETGPLLSGEPPSCLKR